MLGWGADGDQIYTFEHLKKKQFGSEEVYTDQREAQPLNVMLAAFQIPCRGDFAVKIGTNIYNLCKVLNKLLSNHHIIFGTKVNCISDDQFGIFLPSYKCILDFMSWSILKKTNTCDRLIYEARMASFRKSLSPEEFFRMFPRTSCPYIHAWNDDMDDVESTCTLCDGYKVLDRRTRSRSRECIELKQ